MGSNLGSCIILRPGNFRQVGMQKRLISQSLWHLWRVDPPPGTLAGSLVHSVDGVAKGGGVLRGYIYCTQHRNGICRITLFQRFKNELSIVKMSIGCHPLQMRLQPPTRRPLESRPGCIRAQKCRLSTLRRNTNKMCRTVGAVVPLVVQRVIKMMALSLGGKEVNSRGLPAS